LLCNGGLQRYRAAAALQYPEFNVSVQQFYNHFPAEARALKDIDVEGIGKSLNYEMQRHAVNIKNHLVYNFKPRCRKLAASRVKELHPKTSSKVRGKIVNAIMDALLLLPSKEGNPSLGEYVPPMFKPTDPQQATIDTVSAELKALFGTANNINFPVSLEWLGSSTNWDQVFRFYNGLNRLFVLRNMRRFDLLPLCTFRTRCITVDHETMCSIYNIPVN
jgi:hypothetical protein